MSTSTSILIIASSFFEDMFSLAQPVSTESGGGLDSIQISEDSETFDCLMRLCYPVKDPALSNLELVERVLAGATKYQMNEATDLVKLALRPFITDKPLQVYAIACRQQADEEALLAAQRWKKVVKFNDLDAQFAATTPGKSYVPEMDTMSATAYFRLIHFIRNGTFPSPCAIPTKKDGNTISAFYHTSISTADVTLRSFDSVDHPANSAILKAASAGKLLEGPRVEPPSKGTRPIISVALHSSVLGDIVSLCYPLCTPKFNKVEQIRKVAEIAHKYGMYLVVEAAKGQLRDISPRCPLSAYFTATALGWSVEAQHAARHAVEQSIDPFTAYTTEMDDVPARHYRSLLEYQHRFVQCIQCELGATATEVRELCELYQALSTTSGLPRWGHLIPAVTIKTLSECRASQSVGNSNGCLNLCFNCKMHGGGGAGLKSALPTIVELACKAMSLDMKISKVRPCCEPCCSCNGSVMF